MNIPKVKSGDILAAKLKIESLQKECDRIFEAFCKENGIEDQLTIDFVFDMVFNDFEFNTPALKGRLEIVDPQ